MKTIHYLAIVLCLAGCQAASAQFTLPAAVAKENESALKWNEGVIVRMAGPIDIRYVDQARIDAERRALRRQRNTTEFASTLQMSQTQFDNWASGGDNTFSGRATVFFNHKYERGKINTESRIEAKYGLSYIDSKKFKNEDEFKINLLGGWQIKDNWSYAASVNFRSQFSTSYKSKDDNTRLSTFMAPGFLEMAVGFKYERKPFTVVLSPIGGNAVFVLDKELSDKGINGVTPGRKSLWELGPSLQANLDMTFAKDVFRLRSYFYAFTKINMKKRPIFRWETTLDIKATKYLSTTFSTLVHYDRESNARRPKNLQYKYSFAVGLAYTFKNK